MPPTIQLKLSGKEFADLSAEVIGASASIRFRARGSSMSPFVRDGDVLTVDPVHPENLVRGDIVLYRSATGRALAHRVLHIRQGQYLIRGDRDRGAGEPVAGEQIIGRVSRIERNGRIAGHSKTLALTWATLPTVVRQTMAALARCFRSSHLRKDT